MVGTIYEGSSSSVTLERIISAESFSLYSINVSSRNKLLYQSHLLAVVSRAAVKGKIFNKSSK